MKKLIMVAVLISVLAVAEVYAGCDIKDFGNGVYTFSCIEDFAQSLSSFIAAHPELELASMAYRPHAGQFIVVFKSSRLTGDVGGWRRRSLEKSK